MSPSTPQDDPTTPDAGAEADRPAAEQREPPVGPFCVHGLSATHRCAVLCTKCGETCYQHLTGRGGCNAYSPTSG